MAPNPKRRRRSHYRNNNKHCLLCSSWTWEEERLLDAFRQMDAGSLPSRMYMLDPSPCHEGKKCCACKRFICQDCINFFSFHFAKLRMSTPDFFHSKGQCLGPCCWLGKKAWEQSLSTTELPTVRPSDDSFQGSIYLFEYNLTIGNTPVGNTDVFSYGKSRKCDHAILHGVFDDPQLLGCKPKEVLSNDGIIYMLDTSLVIPNKVHQLLPLPLCKAQLRVKVMTVDAVTTKPAPEKGSLPTKEMAVNSLYVQPTKENNEDVDAVLVLGRVPSCDEYQLLLMRFFTVSRIVGDRFEDYKKVLDTTSVWEAWRSGGSNCQPSLSHSFWKFLSKPSASPRNGMGMVVIPFRDHWRFMYLTPYSTDRKLYVVKYRQPHQGGQVVKKKNFWIAILE